MLLMLHALFKTEVNHCLRGSKLDQINCLAYETE